MKHFSTQEWIDFVNQTASISERQAMDRHLTVGCTRCRETVSLWQKVHNTAAIEPSYQPPANAVRLAKAGFSAQFTRDHRRASRGIVQVLFDSFLQPALAGARSVGLGTTRQMLYRADPYQIDVQIEGKPGSNRIVVAGQILDMSNPSLMSQNMRVTLSNCRGNSVLTATSDFGEFVGEVENSGDLELSISGSGERPIVISLRNALGQIPGGKVS